MKFFTTPESRRKYGESLWEFDPNIAVDFIARAWLEEHGTVDEYIAAHDAWKASEPHPIDFMPSGEARPLLDKREAERAKYRAAMDSYLGVLGVKR